MSSHGWLIDLLVELENYSSINNLNPLKTAIAETIEIALEEINEMSYNDKIINFPVSPLIKAKEDNFTIFNRSSSGTDTTHGLKTV